MTAKPWRGRTVTDARAPWVARVNAGSVNCAKCGLPIVPGQRWHLGHQHARALGGGHEASNLHPEHPFCSTSDGGKLAAAMRRKPPPPTQKRRTWL